MPLRALSALALLALASAARPLVKGVPSALSADEQCASGECGAAYANSGGEGAVDHPHISKEEMHHRILRPLGMVHRHIERTLVRKAFPDALRYTMSKAGNYTDGTPAGTPNWIGDVGAQDEGGREPEYASFGSVLDVATGASTANTLEWMASLVHRRDMVAHRYEDNPQPCRTDLIDDHDEFIAEVETSFDQPCLIGATLDEFVSVRSDEEAARRDRLRAAEYGLADKGQFFHVHADWIGGGFLPGRKFDTIFADGVLAPSTDEEGVAMRDKDLVIERLASYLKPGGTLYLIGSEPVGWNDDFAGQPAEIYHNVMEVHNAIRGLGGYHPTRNLPADWVHRTVDRLGLRVVSSTQFFSFTSFDDVREKIAEANEMLREVEAPDDVERSLLQMLVECLERAEEALRHGPPVYSGGQGYVIAATASDDASLPTVDEPTFYQPKRPYRKDQNPRIEKLTLPDLKPGVMETFKWANGDDYDGLGARVGLPPRLPETIRHYVKKLGLWDLMTNTIRNDPMPLNTTRYYNVTSPYGNGERALTWSAKRPDNFYGSDSDMHWFDIADEAAHEDSLRALSKGGFDEVLNAIGTYLGLDHLVTFSIGLLAVTKADKGYTHVDFSHSDRKAFNILINLQTPDGDPGHTELSVIEEDEVGNRRRGQVKYSENFGVLNGDDAMHATNECNHRAYDGVRITASIFLSQLEEASLEQVASHDKYYFPFGNMDWIWAQRGRHWSKDGTASLAHDKGRRPFAAKDELDGCEERVGANKEKCLVNGPERMLCYATCGFFMSEDEFRPGDERKEVFGW